PHPWPYMVPLRELQTLPHVLSKSNDQQLISSSLFAEPMICMEYRSYPHTMSMYIRHLLDGEYLMGNSLQLPHHQIYGNLRYHLLSSRSFLRYGGFHEYLRKAPF